MATMKDVARLAGVSHGTVSNVINGAKGVRLDKVERVEQAMKELRYVPNAIASTLKQSKTMQFDVILPNIIDKSLSLMHTNLSVLGAKLGYTANLHTTNEDADLETKLLNQALMYNKDGVLLMTCQPANADLFRELRERGLKIVFLQRMIAKLNTDFIAVDAKKAAYTAIKQMLQRGYRNMGIIVGPREYTLEKEIFNGFASAHHDMHGEINLDYCATASYDRESALNAAIRILSQEEPPSVVLTSCSQIKESVQKALEVMGIAPERRPLILALVPASWTSSMMPGVIELPLPYDKMADEAFRLLMERVNSPNLHETKQLFVTDEYINIEAVITKHLDTPKKPKEKSTIRILLTDDRARVAVQTMKSCFENTTGYRVEIDYRDYTKMYDAVCEAAQSDEYDVLDLDIPWMEEFAENQWVEALDGRIQSDPLFYNDVPQDVYEEFAVRKGKTYGVPYTFCQQLLFYRKDLFDDIVTQRKYHAKYKKELRPPKTWQEFNQIAEFFTRKFNPDSPTEFGTTLGGRMSSGAVCEYLPRLWSFGGEVHGKKGFTLDSPEAVAALENYKQSYKYASEGSCDNWWPEQPVEFRERKAAMMVLFSDNLTAVTERDKSDIVGKIGFDLLPGKFSVDGGWVLALNRNSKRKDEAYEFMRWVTSREISVISTIIGNFVPNRISIENIELENIYPWIRKNTQARKHGRLRALPKSKSGQLISESMFERILGRAVYDTITGKTDAQTALSEANKELNQIYNT